MKLIMSKLQDAYKTIGEVVEILNLKNKTSNKMPTHTIRYWEKKFKQIKPKYYLVTDVIMINPMSIYSKKLNFW